jgi:hypothetical protein
MNWGKNTICSEIDFLGTFLELPITLNFPHHEGHKASDRPRVSFNKLINIKKIISIHIFYATDQAGE